ncbi:MAG TPA: hypothetical protein VHT93_18600 [Pseudolabrys sp.]|jgi:hypothetical protein|nr:hypothetical protein [Pseudolabrys sp.]
MALTTCAVLRSTALPIDQIFSQYRNCTCIEIVSNNNGEAGSEALHKACFSAVSLLKLAARRYAREPECAEQPQPI